MTRFTLALAAMISLCSVSAQATDFSNVTSGLLLGVYASPSGGGMQVSSTIPGYSAQGRLYSGDILLRTTVDGFQMYNLRTQYEMERAKMAIGGGQQAALEIYRPGVGLIYAWVEFTPIYGPTAAYSVHSSQAQPRAQATFRMEHEKPGARQMFQRKSSGHQHHGGRPVIPERHVHGHHHNHGSNSTAANLFGR